MRGPHYTANLTRTGEFLIWRKRNFPQYLKYIEMPNWIKISYNRVLEVSLDSLLPNSLKARRTGNLPAHSSSFILSYNTLIQPAGQNPVYSLLLKSFEYNAHQISSTFLLLCPRFYGGHVVEERHWLIPLPLVSIYSQALYRSELQYHNNKILLGKMPSTATK